MDETEQMKQRILAEYERLGPDSEFSFRCHPGVHCYNSCCGDVNIALTPYDILRLRRRLGISSGEFLTRYTVRPFTKDQTLPVVLLKMEDHRQGKPCPFVSEPGCSVYEDRPWPCRMYPVGTASARTDADPDGPEFYFLMSEDRCGGFEEEQGWTIRKWMDNQGVGPYDEWGELFKEINLHPHFRGGGTLNPQQMEMYFTACYDLDRFRSFVLESRFLDLYEVEPETVEQLRADDEALLRFAFRWLKTCLFREETIKLRQQTVETYKERLRAQGKKV
jgi:Fe-S-cluster containining protein